MRIKTLFFGVACIIASSAVFGAPTPFLQNASSHASAGKFTIDADGASEITSESATMRFYSNNTCTRPMGKGVLLTGEMKYKAGSPVSLIASSAYLLLKEAQGVTASKVESYRFTPFCLGSLTEYCFTIGRHGCFVGTCSDKTKKCTGHSDIVTNLERSSAAGQLA